MSLSPTSHSSSEEVFAYDKGWAALNRLIRAGRSFSGREQNCCFLNVGQTRFANVSAALELNLPDDGRGLATVDWDQDGRLDFWITNRNGPRVRFLRNEYSTDHHFLALRLQGTRVNRDAIGARVEVFVPGSSVPFIKTLAAGSGFLSQSSKWLHFGLGDATEIERVVVHWPGGDSETFEQLRCDARYLLREGSPDAVVQPATTRGSWKPSKATEPSLPVTDRVVLLEPAPIPDVLAYHELDGSRKLLVPPPDERRGTLINLWATWCPNCVSELSNWSSKASEFERLGIKVLAVCVDESSDDMAADRQRIAAFSQGLGWPFTIGLSDDRTAAALNIFQRAFIGRQTDLPLPSSLLLDREGRVAVIYKGPVEASRVLEDSQLLNQPREVIQVGAIPFTGRWLEPAPRTVARMAAMAFTEHGDNELAEAYVRQLLSLYDRDSKAPCYAHLSDEERNSELATLNHFLGAILFDRKDLEGARHHYSVSLELSPYGRGVRRELYRTLLQLDRPAEAAEQLEQLLESNANDPETLVELGRLRIKLGQSEAAIERFAQSLALKPDFAIQFELANLQRAARQYRQAIENYRAVMAGVPSPVVYNNLAWLLATADDAEVRDGAEAIRLANHACEITQRQSPRMLGTLAAAHAETGDFSTAVKIGMEAVELAAKTSDPIVDELRDRVGQYEAGQPTRE